MICFPIHRLAGLLVVSLCLSGSVSADDLRTWTDSTGAFKIEARFVSVADGTVTLEQKDGKQLEIPLDKLSRTDQMFVKALPANNPFQAKPNSPFMPKDGGAEKPASTTGGDWVVDDHNRSESRLVKVDTSSADAISLFDAAGEWKLDPAELAGTPPADHAGKPIRLKAKVSFFEKITGLKITPDGAFAAIGYKLDSFDLERQSRVVIVDLATKKVIADRTTRGVFDLLAIADDGQVVVMRTGESDRRGDRLELWKVQKDAILKGPAWIPHDDAQNADRDIEWAAYSGPAELLTCSKKGIVVAWTLDPIAPKWTCATGGGGLNPALSPSRKYLAVADGKQLSVIDLAQAKVAAARTLDRVAFPKLAFSPEGTRLAITGLPGNYVFESATGEIYRDVDQATGTHLSRNHPLTFVNEDQALVGGSTILDLPSLIPLWRYEFADAFASSGGAVFFAVSKSDKEEGVLFGAKLPHAAALAALDKALADPNYFLVRPGCKVKLNLDALPDADKREEARKHLTKQLESLEMQVDPSSPLELVCRFDGPKGIKLDFIGAGEVDFNETVARMAYVFQGQDVWTTASSNRPFMIQYSIKDGVQAALKKYETPSYGLFLNAKLPRMVTHPSQGQKNGLGTSQVTVTGIR